MSDESGWEEARLLRAEVKKLKDAQDGLIIAIGTVIQAHEELSKAFPFDDVSEETGLEFNALLQKHDGVIRNAEQAIRNTRPEPDPRQHA